MLITRLTLLPNFDWLGDDVVLWTPEAGTFLHGRKRLAGNEVAGTRSHGPLGRYAQWSGAGTSGVQFGAQQVLTSQTGYTVAVVAKPTSASNRMIALSQRTSGTNVPQINLAFNASGILGVVANSVVLYGRNSAAGVFSVHRNGGDTIDGKLHCWVAANSTSDGYIYRSGVEQTLTTNQRVTGTPIVSTQHTRIGNSGDYTADSTSLHDDPLYLVLAWPRLIPRKLAQEISARLATSLEHAFWRRTIHAPTATAAGGTPTLSNTILTNIGTTYGTPRVTITFS